MIIQEYQDCFFDYLVMLHESQNYTHTNKLEPSLVPKSGYIVTNGAITMAAGFLREVEGGFAQIDTLVSNGHASKEDRAKAMNLLVDKLLDKASSMKLRGVFFLSEEPSILLRASEHGFSVINQVVMGKAL